MIVSVCVCERDGNEHEVNKMKNKTTNETQNMNERKETNKQLE